MTALQKILELPSVEAFQLTYTKTAGIAYRAVVNGEQHEVKKPNGHSLESWLRREAHRLDMSDRIKVTVN